MLKSVLPLVAIPFVSQRFVFASFQGVCRMQSSLPPESIPQKQPNMLNSIKYRFGIGLRYPSVKLAASGENMFAVCAEYPEIKDFVDTVGLPDTFQTWFSLTTLHVWLCLVRLRKEGQEGRLIKQTFVKLIWVDLKSRMRGFGIIRKQHDHVEQFNMQFFGSLFAYDEAFMMHSDCALAAALWRNFFLSSDKVPTEKIEMLVAYVRKQLEHLDKIPSEVIVGKGAPTFLRLKENKLNSDYSLRRLRYCFTWPEWAK